MKTVEQINARLKELEQDKVGAQKWVNKAEERYCSERKAFGDADRGEMETAFDQLREINVSIAVLTWVLES